MRQDQFIARHEADWQVLASWLDAAERRKPGAHAIEAGCHDAEVPQRYRRLCQPLHKYYCFPSFHTSVA